MNVDWGHYSTSLPSNDECYWAISDMTCLQLFTRTVATGCTTRRTTLWGSVVLIDPRAIFVLAPGFLMGLVSSTALRLLTSSDRNDEVGQDM